MNNIAKNDTAILFAYPGGKCPRCRLDGLLRGPSGGGNEMVCCRRCATEFLTGVHSYVVAEQCDIDRLEHIYPQALEYHRPLYAKPT